MNKLEEIKNIVANKEVAIFGCGISAMAAKTYLDKIGIKSVLYQESNSKKENTQLSSSNFDEECVKKHNLVIYSPAFKLEHPWLQLAKEHKLHYICESDFSALIWASKLIAITGTNGKTTITSFVSKALNDAGINAIAVGNIGEPLCNHLDKNDIEVAVYEISSFQSSKLLYFKPDALIWTNFAPDHLDWHKSMEEYFQAKYNLITNSKSEKIYLGKSVARYAKEYGFKIPEKAIIIDDTKKYEAPAPFDSITQSQNFEMAKLLLEDLGLKLADIEESAKTFELPEHRFGEYIKVKQVKFYNDSKATNIHASLSALDNFKYEDNLVWIGGGKNKNCDLSELVKALEKKCKAVFLIGQTAQILKKELSDKIKVEITQNLEEAIKKAYIEVENGGNVLFSPAFSSFGMFENFAQRGKSFKNLVLCLKNEKELSQ